MTQTKKFDYRIVPDKQVWAAEITRRMTARKTIVSKRKTGFETEIAAKAWGEKTLQTYLDNLMAKNERKATQRTERNEQLESKEAKAAAWREAKDAQQDGVKQYRTGDDYLSDE